MGNTTLPAGAYDVSYDAAAAPGILVVRSQDARHEVFGAEARNGLDVLGTHAND